MFFLISCNSDKGRQTDLEKIVKNRPSTSQYLYDYAKIMESTAEYSNRYLWRISQNYNIEAVIISLPSLEQHGTIEEISTEIFSNWQIGRDHGGRGVLLLLVDDQKRVKMEVSYELEDVFTDAFCGYIADMQLKPYFLSRQIGTGLMAVMEELENRAQIKHQGNYTADSIKSLDVQLLSGGAGAGRNLTGFQEEEVKKAGQRYPAKATPQETWETMIQSWKDKARDPDLGIYTEIAKLVYRDYQNLPDSRYEKDVSIYANKPYQVIKNEDYAVIFFGNKKGWENAPFLLCRKEDGWKFDIVHQRKFIRRGVSPDWGMEMGNHPYMDILTDCPFFMGQDIPLQPDDIYTIDNDGGLAMEIIKLEKEFKNNPDDFKVGMQLGRLYTITSMYPKSVAILNRIKGLNPSDPFSYKYLAIAHVDANYQYNTAIGELLEYIKRMPDDLFAYNFLGYCYLCLNEYKKAIDQFEKAITLDKDNCYAYCKLSRIHGALYLKDSDKSSRTKAIEMYEKAKGSGNIDHRRIEWLRTWLEGEKIIR